MPVGRTSSAAGLSVRRPDAGVTLIELVVVMAIIGLLAGMSYPAVSAGLDSMRLSSATRSAASFLQGAVDRADRRQEVVELIISPAENTMALYSTQPGFRREMKFPEGVRLEAVLPAVPNGVDPTRRIVLMPGGTAPAIGLEIVNRHGSRRIVRLDPMTGYPRVEGVETR